MGDTFYRAVKAIGRHAFWVSSAPVVSGLEHIPCAGPAIIASNHTSPFDVPLLIRHVPRAVDFVSTVEVFRHRFVGWFYGSMSAFQLDRARADAPAVRTILDRLARGRVIGMFPEGGFRRGEASVIHSGRMRPGVGRLAVLASAPVVPVVILNSAAYARPHSWLPVRRVRYGLAVGPAISPSLGAEAIERQLVDSFARLYHELAPKLPEGCRML